MICSNEVAAPTKKKLNQRVPWLTDFEDDTLCNGQAEATCRKSGLEHSTQLDINSNPKISRLTKIMVTLGCPNPVDVDNVCVFLPFDLGVANSDPGAIVNMMMVGANIVRLNMSHQVDKWHAITVQSIRQAGDRMYEFTGEIYPLGVATSLRGPEIRTGIFRGDASSIGYADLKEGNVVKLLTNDVAKRAGCVNCFWVSYPELPRVCRPGDKILIGRGVALLQLGFPTWAISPTGEADVVCKVLKGGIVRDEALVQLLDSIVELPQLSKTDEEQIELTSFLECDFCIVNHTRNEKMVEVVKTGFDQMSTIKICVIAKISSQQGLDCLDEILLAADGILLDRASVEIEVGPERLFLVEKVVVAKCLKAGKPVILSFHVSKKNASKLDVNLIANAVLSGVDVIFLKTGELNGKETSELIKKVDVVCRQAESARYQREIFDELACKMLVPPDPMYAVTVGAIQTSLNLNAAAIIVATTSGRSAALLSVYRPHCPILAVTRCGDVARWLQLYHGLHPIHYRQQPLPDWNDELNSRIQSGVDSLRRRRYIKVGDAVVIVTGCREGSGFTNSIRVAYVSPGQVGNEATNLEPCW